MALMSGNSREDDFRFLSDVSKKQFLCIICPIPLIMITTSVYQDERRGP